jgi:hypothetical protein
MSDKNVNIKFTVDTADSAKTLKETKQAIKDLKDEALSYGDASSEGFIKASKKAAELKDKLEDLGDSMKTLQGSTFEKLSGSFQKLKEGVFNLDLDKVKTGIAGIGDGFGSMVKSALSGLSSIQKGLIATGIGALVVALGLIVAYWDDIKGLVDGITPELKNQVKLTEEKAAASQKELDTLSGSDEIMKAQGKTQKEILQAKEKAAQVAINDLEAVLMAQEAQKKSQIEAATRNRDILQGIIRFVTAPITALLKGIDMVGKAFGKDFGLEEGFSGGIAKLVFDPKETEKKADETIQKTNDALLKLKNQQAGFHNSISEIDNKAADDKKSKADKATKEREDREAKEREAAKKLASEKLNIEEKYGIDAANLEIRLTEESKKRKDLSKEDILKRVSDQLAGEKKLTDEAAAIKKADDDKRLADEKKGIEDSNKILIDAQKSKNDRIINSEKSSNIDKLNAQKDNLDLEMQNELSTAYLTEEAKKAIEDKYRLLKEDADKAAREKEKAARKEQFDAIANTAAAGINAFGSLSDSIFAMKQSKMKKDSAEYLASQKKQFEISKKVQIASATIAGIQGVINALTAPTVVPEPVGSILKGVNAAIVAVSTAANINKIRATSFEGGGGGGTPDSGSSGVGGSTSAPSIQAAQLVTLGQPTLTRSIGQRDNKVVVTDKDIKSVGNRVNVIEDRSKIKLGD